MLLLENIHPVAVEILQGHGFEVELRSSSMSEDELVESLADVQLLGIRSNTHITAAGPRARARTCWRWAASASAPTRST